MALVTSMHLNVAKPEQLEMADYSHVEKTGAQVTEEPQDPETIRLERNLKWKLDLFILPLIACVYFFASMVRSNLCRSFSRVSTNT